MRQSGDAIYLALWLIIPISALAARRLPIGRTVKMAVAWLAIFAVLFLIIAGWQMATGAGGALASIYR